MACVSYVVKVSLLALALVLPQLSYAVGETTTVTVCTGKVDPSKPGPQC